MWLPFGNKTVTLLHKTDSGYAQHILSGCSWTDTEAKSANGDAITHTIETTCRIPAPYQAIPKAGDLLILGNVNAAAKNEIELVQALETARENGYQAFRAQRVKDNSRSGVLAHYAVMGE